VAHSEATTEVQPFNNKVKPLQCWIKQTQQGNLLKGIDSRLRCKTPPTEKAMKGAAEGLTRASHMSSTMGKNMSMARVMARMGISDMNLSH